MGNKSTIGPDQPHDAIERKILEITSSFLVPGNLSRQEVWLNIENRIANLPAAKVVSFQLNTFLRIAASVLVFVLAGLAVYQSQEVSLQTAFAERNTITLPDQSIIELNAGSSLSYNKLTWSLTRKVYFTGEGLFSVAKGDKFEVISPNGITQVLGTQFNLISRGALYRVACLEGKVSVRNTEATSQVILTPGLQTELQQNTLSAARSYNSNITSWKTGEFYFDNTPLTEVLATLEVQYNINIIAEKSDRKYTGYFTNGNLEEALKLVCLPLQLHYDFTDSMTIKISTKK